MTRPRHECTGNLPSGGYGADRATTEQDLRRALDAANAIIAQEADQAAKLQREIDRLREALERQAADAEMGRLVREASERWPEHALMLGWTFPGDERSAVALGADDRHSGAGETILDAMRDLVTAAAIPRNPA